VNTLARPRRKRIILLVFALGLLAGLLELITLAPWGDWEAGNFTPIPQTILLSYGIGSLLDTHWVEGALILLYGALLFFFTSLLAIAPLLLSQDQRRRWAKFLLLLLLLTSVVAWLWNWALPEWGPRDCLRLPLVFVNGALAGLALIAAWFWHRNPDGRAAFWYTAALQVWIQTLWIPWPDDD